MQNPKCQIRIFLECLIISFCLIQSPFSLVILMCSKYIYLNDVIQSGLVNNGSLLDVRVNNKTHTDICVRYFLSRLEYSENCFNWKA